MKQVLKLALLLTSACAFSNHSFASTSNPFNPLAEELAGFEGKVAQIPQISIPQNIILDLENNLNELKSLKTLVKKNNNASVSNNNNFDSNLTSTIGRIASGLTNLNGSINSNEQLKASVGNIGVSASNKTSVHAKGMGVSDVATLVSVASTFSNLVNDGQLNGDVQNVLTAAKSGINLLNTIKGSLLGNDAKLPAVPANNLPVKKRDL